MPKYAFNASVFFGSPAVPAPTSTTVEVRDQYTDAVVDLWSDGAGTLPLDNPFNITTAGKISFFSDAMTAEITATNGADSDVWSHQIIGPVPRAVTAVSSSSGVVTLNANLGDYFTMTTTENITDVVVTGLDGLGFGASIMLKITQGATDRTATWPAEFEFTHDTGQALKTGVGAVSVLALTTFDNGTTFTATLGGGE